MPDGEETLSDEELRKLLKPAPSTDEMVDLVQRHFAHDGQIVVVIKELESYDDRNYWVKISGVDHLVKVHNGVESKCTKDAIEAQQQDSVIHFQYAMMKTLDDKGISASRPVFAKNEAGPLVVHLPVVSASHSPCALILSVYSWVAGIPMSSLRVLPIECLADSGKFLGKVHQALDSMPLDEFPAAKRYHQWDGKNTCDLRNFTQYIQTEERRAMIESIISTFQKELIDSGAAKSLRVGINHGDFNDANILMDGDFRVTGVIDFGDSVASWRVLDVSVACAYAMLTTYGKSGRSISAAAAFLRGFHSVYQLTETERKHLVLLIACRLACSVTLGAYSYQQNPENKYLLLHAEPAWIALEFIWGLVGNEDARTRVNNALDIFFDIACEHRNGGASDCGDLSVSDEHIMKLYGAGMLLGRNDEKQVKRQKHSKEKVITFVTGNKKKLEEVERILFDDSDANSVGFSLTNAKLDLPELQGDPLSIAKEKCEAAARVINGAVITEDTSLCFIALKDLPGPYIKWFLDKCGHDGLNKMIEAYDDKSAYAQTVVAFCPGPGLEVSVFVGRTAGKIVSPRGALDFGWDPIFEPDEGNGKTYAEMDKKEKDSISHRGRSFNKFKEYLIKEKANILKQIR